MNAYQQTLWNDLMALADGPIEAFYYTDHEYNGMYYRIFNYRLASYTDFLQPSALECRGVMFQITEDGKPILLASLPMEKFFNLHENPFTMNPDLSSVCRIEEKADGSLISTFVHLDKTNWPTLGLKSKGSLTSQQAIDADAYLNQPENWMFAWELKKLALQGYTCNMEWVAPTNRIVIGYMEPALRVLNIRNNRDGLYVSKEDLEAEEGQFVEFLRRWIPEVNGKDPVKFIEQIPSMTGIEGYVVHLRAGQKIKIKTSWYLALHHTKDSINSPRRLFEAVLEETTDDMRAMFYDDPIAIKMIADMEQFVEHHYNHMVDTVERFHEKNKELSRKEYAVLGQQELDPMFFGLAMNKYVGKPFDYKDFLKKQWKKLGLKDKEEIEYD